MEYSSAIKKNEIMPFTATWMDLDIVLLSEDRQTKEKYCMKTLICESKKKWYKWIYLKKRKRSTHLEKELMVASGKDGVKG